MRKKIRESKTTGSGGFRLTPLDNLILDATGRDSAYWGLGVKDPGPFARKSQPPPIEDDSFSQANFFDPVPGPSPSNQTSETEFEFRRPLQQIGGAIIINNGLYMLI